VRSVLVLAAVALLQTATAQTCPAPLRSRSWTDLDRRASASDEYAERSLDALAAHLRRTAQGEGARLRAAFTWAATQVSYDHAALTGPRPSQSAETVLATRLGVCEGIARLTVALATRLGLEAVAVGGWATPPSGVAAVAPDGLHMWVAARVDGRWTLSDPTWAAGAPTLSTWFDVPPDEFVRTHLPQEARWQLLTSPLTPDDAVARRWPSGGCVAAPLADAGPPLHALTQVSAAADGPPWRVEQGVRFRVWDAPEAYARNRPVQITAEVEGATEVALFEGAVLRQAMRRSGTRWTARFRPALGPVVIAARLAPGTPWRMLDGRPVQP
jgi:hypothetical protein